MKKFKILILGLALNLNLPVACTHAGKGVLDPEVTALFKLFTDSKRSEGARLSREERSMLRYVLAQEAKDKAEHEKALCAEQQARDFLAQQARQAQEKLAKKEYFRKVNSGSVKKPKGWSPR